ncbi:DNA translocase FtsK 4TM domain-containing protein [Anaerotignum sp.]
MAEQKNKKTTAKTTAKKTTETKKTPAKSSEKKTETKKKETTKVNAKPARFGDSLLDEIILLLIIVVSIVVFVSLLTDKMGIIGGLISTFVKGLFGFSGLLLPVFVVLFCVWMLASEEKKHPVVRAIGAGLFLLVVASAAHIINPVETGDAGFLKRCGMLYGEGSFGNGGLLGGLIGGGLHSLLDTLGSVIILLAAGIISIVMATGKSFFHAIGDANAHRKARKKVRNEKIKNKAERIRQQELVEAERLAKKEERRKKTMSKEDFNIELQESKDEEVPYVKETVFQKKPVNLETKKKEPIFDFVKEKEREANLKAAAEKYVAETSNNAMKAAASMMADSALKSVQMQEELPVMPKTEEPKVETPVVQMPEIDENAPIIDIAGVDEATLMPARKAEPVEEDIPIIEMAPAIDELQEEVSEEAPAIEMETAEMEEPAVTEEETAEEPAAEGKKAEDVPEPEIPTEPVEEEKPYIYPPIELLGADPQTGSTGNRAEMIENAKKLESTLKSFGVDAKVIQISKGPTVTRYELSPSQGVKVSKIVNLADDIALNLAASGIRIEAPIPGKAAVGIEVPNKETQSVYMRTLLESDAFKEHQSKLAFALGQDIAGNPVVTDIAKMPHLLIAGATGSGKSVCINTLITSILYKADPKEVKLLLVDPKVVELSVYNGIPHLLIPVVTDPKKASSALNWAVREMLQRYNDFAAHGVRDIKGFNKMMEDKGDEKGKMPQIVIIIDELADLMMAAPGEVEDSICRLAQMARAAGMHLIIATQRPSVDVITGVIKANIPSRLAFAVSSGIDSRTILDMVGAEKLLGKGDMLFYPSGQSKPSRLQGAFVTDQEVEAIVDFLKKSSRPYYTQETIDQITSTAKAGGGDVEDSDEFFGPAVDLILEKEKASVSMLQRQFRIGYNRAARLMDDLERHGIVGPEEGSKPRKVLITRSEWEEMTGAVPEEI